jgi:hypothetical protein
MTKEQYLEYVKDDKKEVTPLMFFYYKLKGGTANEFEFYGAWAKWVLLVPRQLAGIYRNVFKDLNEHFKI